MRRLLGVVLVGALCVGCSSGSAGRDQDRPSSSDVDVDDVTSTSPVSSSDGSNADQVSDTSANIDRILRADPVYADLTLDYSTYVEHDVIATEGGEITTISPEGDTFTLVIPPDALLGDTSVSLTIASNESIIGVNIEPDGVFLRKPAVIHVDTEKTTNDRTPVWWDGTGEINRAASTVGEGSDVDIHTGHFSGYGLANGDAPLPEKSPMDSLDPTSMEGIYTSYLSPLLSKSQKSGCASHRIIDDSVRFLLSTERFGLSELEERVRAKMDKQGENLYSSMKDCAREKCSKGDDSAPVKMIGAVAKAQALGLSAVAETEGLEIAQEVLLGGPTSPWARCREFAVTMGATMNWSIRFVSPTFTDISSHSIGQGVLLPNEKGHSGDVATMETTSGMVEYSIREGNLVMDGLEALLSAADLDVACSQNSANRGVVGVSLTWNQEGLPLATFEPLSSIVTWNCSYNGKSFPVSGPHLAYVLMTLDPVSLSSSATFDHQFSKAELWPSTQWSNTPIGFMWAEKVDRMPEVVADGASDMIRRADTQIMVKIILRSTHSPEGEAPSRDGLVPSSQFFDSMG